MKIIKFLIVSLVVWSAYLFAAEPVGTAPSSQAKNSAAQSKNGSNRHVPIVGSMLPDGREVPVRFQGMETKEQKARRERQEQQKNESEEE